MSSIILKTMEQSSATGSLPFTTVSSGFFILLLIILLIEKEVVRTLASQNTRDLLRTLDIFIIPGIIAIGFIFFARLVALII